MHSGVAGCVSWGVPPSRWCVCGGSQLFRPVGQSREKGGQPRASNHHSVMERRALEAPLQPDQCHWRILGASPAPGQAFGSATEASVGRGVGGIPATSDGGGRRNSATAEIRPPASANAHAAWDGAPPPPVWPPRESLQAPRCVALSSSAIGCGPPSWQLATEATAGRRFVMMGAGPTLPSQATLPSPWPSPFPWPAETAAYLPQYRPQSVSSTAWPSSTYWYLDARAVHVPAGSVLQLPFATSICDTPAPASASWTPKAEATLQPTPPGAQHYYDQFCSAHNGEGAAPVALSSLVERRSQPATTKTTAVYDDVWDVPTGEVARGAVVCAPSLIAATNPATAIPLYRQDKRCPGGAGRAVAVAVAVARGAVGSCNPNDHSTGASRCIVGDDNRDGARPSAVAPWPYVATATTTPGDAVCAADRGAAPLRLCGDAHGGVGLNPHLSGLRSCDREANGSATGVDTCHSRLPGACTSSTLEHRETIARAKYWCVRCSYKTDRHGDLLKHARVHAGIKERQCDWCEYTTRDSRCVWKDHALVSGGPVACCFCCCDPQVHARCCSGPGVPTAFISFSLVLLSHLGQQSKAAPAPSPCSATPRRCERRVKCRWPVRHEQSRRGLDRVFGV